MALANICEKNEKIQGVVLPDVITGRRFENASPLPWAQTMIRHATRNMDDLRRSPSGANRLCRAERDRAVIAIHQYSTDTYNRANPERPKGPSRSYKVPPRKYVAGFGPYVKIGVASNVDERMSALQTPEPIESRADGRYAAKYWCK